jgi:hypothetical protein
MQILKDELVQQIQTCHDLIQSNTSSKTNVSSLTESTVHEILEKRLKLADSEVALQIEHLE